MREVRREGNREELMKAKVEKGRKERMSEGRKKGRKREGINEVN